MHAKHLHLRCMHLTEVQGCRGGASGAGYGGVMETRYPPLQDVNPAFEGCFSLYGRDWQLAPAGGVDRWLVVPDGSMRAVATVAADGHDWSVWSEADGDRHAFSLREAIETAIEDHLRS